MRVGASLAVVALGASYLSPLVVERCRIAMIDRESRSENGSKGLAISLEGLVGRGEAATLEEAQQLLSSRGRSTALQNMVDSGRAANTDEAAKLLGADGLSAALNNMVERGEAATLEDAQQLLSSKARAASLQNIIDRGEAATLDEAARVLGSSGLAVALQNMVDRGEAANLQEAKTKQAKRSLSVAAANQPLGHTGLSMRAGVARALKSGKRVRFPGVYWRSDTCKWRLSFTYKRKKISLGSFDSEEEAARAHDECVGANGLSRPLHFPLDGELSSTAYVS